MLKQGAFVNKKFNRFVLGNIWGCLAYSVNLMIDSLISGNQLGESSLQAVSIVYPLMSLISFFSCLVSPGGAILFGRHIGEFRKEDAYKVSGTTVVSSVLIGFLLAIGLWLVKEPFLNYFHCTGVIYCEASAYYNWVILFTVIRHVSDAIYYLIVADGEASLISVACVTDVVGHIVLSIFLSRRFGIAGLGMATCIGVFLRALLYCLHFLKKSNNLKLRLCLYFGILKHSIVLGYSQYMYYLFLAVVDIVMNKIIISSCGMEYIPAYSVINLVFGVCELYISLNAASVGLITCFVGEKNNHGLNLIFRKVTRATVIMAFGISGFFFFAAPLMPILYGLETQTTIQAAVTASRIMAFTVLGFSACYMGSAVSCSVEKPGQACFLAFLRDVFAPLLLSLLFGFLWGFTGITVGMSLSPYFAFCFYTLIRIPRKGKKGFPIYVEDFGEEGISFDLYVTKGSIIEVREWLHGNLEARGFDTEKTDLLIEEFYTRVMEKNPGKKVLSECTLLFKGDVVRIIIRDDGTLFNFVDENNKVESLNAHVLNSLLEQTKEKNYVLTTSFNRNGFVFTKEQTA